MIKVPIHVFLFYDEREESIATYDIIADDQEVNESERNSTKQSLSTSTQLSTPLDSEGSPPERKLVHKSANSSITQSSKGAPANILNTRAEEAYEILTNTVANCNVRDGSTIY